jgi:hypothetical protein
MAKQFIQTVNLNREDLPLILGALNACLEDSGWEFCEEKDTRKRISELLEKLKEK